jgi:hypothetical protein
MGRRLRRLYPRVWRAYGRGLGTLDALQRLVARLRNQGRHWRYPLVRPILISAGVDPEGDSGYVHCAPALHQVTHLGGCLNGHPGYSRLVPRVPC